MDNKSIDCDNFAVPLPITQFARNISLQFASEQPNPDKAKRVRLNTLAVLVVKDYLTMMGIKTSLDNCNSWNRMMRICSDAADLEIREVGLLECIPIANNREYFTVSAEVWHDRIGYTIVEISDDLCEAKILGFLRQTEEEEVSKKQLESPEYFLDYLAAIEKKDSLRVNLSRWLSGIFEEGWQDVSNFYNSVRANFNLAFRGSIESNVFPSRQEIRKAKLLLLEEELLERSLLLILNIRDDRNERGGLEERKIQISMQLHPLDRIYLPEGLDLQILDGEDLVFLNARSRNKDNYLQLDFYGNIGEFFGIKIASRDSEIRENFQI